MAGFTKQNTMKNTLTIVALTALFAGALFAAETTTSWVDDLSVQASVGFDSEYVFRGRNIDHNVITATLDGSYKLYKGSLYTGLKSINGQDSTYTETNLYVGYKLPVYEKFSADFGGTYYYYSNDNPAIDRTFELYAGLIYNGLYVNPAVYVFYDFALEQWVGELSGKYSWDLSKYGMANTSLDVGAFLGVLAADDADSDQVAGDTKNSYMYYGVTADLVYSFTKTASASIGIAYNGNDDDQSTGDKLFDRENSFFWGAKFTAGF